ncbi:MAG: amidoligase family protein [Culicoidibacterales bacterium]
MTNDLQFGIEVECVTPLNRFDLKDALKKVFDCKVNYVACSGWASRNMINIYTDYSVTVLKDDKNIITKKMKADVRYIPLYVKEIVFPIVSETRMKEIFRLLQTEFYDKGFLHINKTCGQHVSVSFVDNDMHKSVDLAKLSVSYDVDKWKDVFGRKNNHYCGRMITVTDIKQSFKKSKGGAEVMVESLNSILKYKNGRYRAINCTDYFKKPNKPGRIEFRVAGGEKAMNSKLMIRHLNYISKAMLESVKFYSPLVTRRLNKRLSEFLF